MNIITIDIGSSNTKCCVVSCLDQKVLFHSFTETPDRLVNDNPLYFEIDTRNILNVIDNFINEATAKYSISGLFFSTQMHGYVYQAEDNPSKYVSWQDSRCLQQYNGEVILDTIEKNADEAIVEKLGIPIKSSMGVLNLYADSLLNPNFNKNGTLYSLGSYLIHHYTGENVTHITNAAPMGILDITNNTINHEWIRFLALDNIDLPVVTDDPYTSCGNFTMNNQTIKVFPDLGDQQVSILGAKARKDEFIFNIATAAQICCIEDNVVHGNYEIRPYFENSYLYTVTNLPAGRNLKLLVDFVKESNELFNNTLSDQEIYDKVHSILTFDTTLKINTDFFSKNGGSMFNINYNNFTIKELFEGTYNDIVDKYNYTTSELLKDFKHNKGLFLGGVAYHNETLVNLINTRLRLNSTVSKSKFDIFNGLLRIALIAFGLYPNIESTYEISLKEDI